MSTASEKKVLVCTNFRANPNHPSCGARDSDTLFKSLSEALQDMPILIESSPCMGLCHAGPNVRLVPSGKCFNEVSTQELTLVIEEIKSFIAY
jgi:(2Fe-2S) ferredoxin